MSIVVVVTHLSFGEDKANHEPKCLDPGQPLLIASHKLSPFISIDLRTLDSKMQPLTNRGWCHCEAGAIIDSSCLVESDRARQLSIQQTPQEPRNAILRYLLRLPSQRFFDKEELKTMQVLKTFELLLSLWICAIVFVGLSSNWIQQLWCSEEVLKLHCTFSARCSETWAARVTQSRVSLWKFLSSLPELHWNVSWAVVPMFDKIFRR